MSALDQITDFINDTLGAAVVVGGTSYHGITRLVVRDGKTAPVCQNQGQARQIVPERGKPLQIYHRIEGEIQLQDTDGEGFGVGVEQRLTYQHSLFGLGIRKEITTDPVMDTWNLGLFIANALSEGTSEGFPVASSIRRVFLSDFSIESNDRRVLTSELAGNDIQQDQLDVMAFRIRFTVTADVCGDLCT